MNGPAQDAIAARFAQPAPPTPTSGTSASSAAEWAAERQQSFAPDSSGGGFSGPFGFVLNNPVSQAILRPLQFLDYGRSAVVSGVNQAIFEDDPSVGGWLEGTQEHIGFGDVIGETGNKWLDRAIGFTGDVALDPLTYLTFGTGKFAGAGGRMAAAGELAMVAEKATDEGVKVLAKRAAEKVARLGVSSLKAEERALLPGMGEAGLRLMGKRLPGTGTLAETLGSGGGRLRAGLYDTPVGGLLTHGPGKSPEIQEAMGRLLRGQGDLDPLDAANRVAAHYVEKAKAGRFRTIQVNRAKEIARELGHSRATRSELTHAIERGEATPLTTRAAELYETLRTDAVYSGGVQLPKLEGGRYMPHRFTDYGANFLKKSDLPDSVVTSKGAASAAQKHRLLRVGQKITVGDKTRRVTDDSIQGLNDFFRKEFGAHADVFEDDFVRLTDKYIDEVSRSVGRAHGINRLAEGGSAWLPNDEFVTQPTKAARKAIREQTEYGRILKQSHAWKDRPLWDDLKNAADNVSEDEADLMVADVAPMETAAGVDIPDDSMWQRPTEPEEVDFAERVAQHLEQQGDPETAQLARQYNPVAEAVGDGTERGVAREVPEDFTFTEEDLDDFLKETKSGKYDKSLERELKKGFEVMGKQLLAGGEGVVVRAQLANAMKNVQQSMAKNWFWRGTDAYTQFFKQYATMSPGFHLRNGMSAAFMNFADGVTLSAQIDGIRNWSKYLDDPAGYIESVPLPKRQQMADALDAVYGAGGGAGQYSADELVQHGARVNDWWLPRASRWAGAQVEGVARMGMAIDTLQKGGSVAEATARIARIHFDYSELSKLDRTMKRIIPFWTFMSRNLPLQTQQMWMKPRLYQQYQSLVRNMGQDYEGDMVPKSWQDVDAFKLSDGTYLAPDFAHTRQLKDLSELTDPFGGRMFSDVNPLLRVPMETLVANKAFFTGHEFQPNQYEELTFNKSPELAWLRPVLDLLGQVEQAGPTGNVPVIGEKLDYALHQAVPTLAQGQRLIPSGDDYYGDRNLQSLMGWLGIPLKTLTEGQTEAEQRRREFGQGADEEEARRKADALRRFLEGD